VNWYLLTRRAAATAGLIVIVGVATFWLAPLPTPLPDFTGTGAKIVPAAFMLPAVSAMVIMISLSERGAGSEAQARRRLARWDSALVCAYLVLAVALLGLAFAATGEALMWASARNTAGYVGAGLLVGASVGWRAGALAPIAYAVIAAAFAPGYGAHPMFWPMRATDDLLAGVIAALLCFLGVALLALRPATRR